METPANKFVCVADFSSDIIEQVIGFPREAPGSGIFTYVIGRVERFTVSRDGVSVQLSNSAEEGSTLSNSLPTSAITLKYTDTVLKIGERGCNISIDGGVATLKVKGAQPDNPF